MFTDWQQVRNEGIDRHRTLLAEAAPRRRVRQTRRQERAGGHDQCGAVAGMDGAGMAARWPIEEGAAGCAGFTAQERQRLLVLRWRYRRGQLTD